MLTFMYVIDVRMLSVFMYVELLFFSFYFLSQIQ